jgi:phosphinothricin acetyltransferase
MIRNATQTDAKQLSEIYNYYIKNTAITFEENPVSTEEMATRIQNVQNHQLPWLVIEEQGDILGYAYATKWKERAAYRFTVEVTVYLSQNAHGKGLGTMLYNTLFQQLSAQGIHTAIGGITLPNDASVALHEKLGMKKVAHFIESGFKFEQWLDVGYWQKTLN